jgi:FtsP/CotA-like multicopper oxidase with cupredoxin domain
MSLGTRLLFFAFLFLNSLSAQTDTLDFHVRSGNLTLFDGTQIPHLVYTEAEVIPRNSDVVIREQGEEILFRLINNDDEIHGIQIPGILTIPTVMPADTAEVLVNLLQTGIFRYFDPVDSFRNSYLGLSGIFHVKATTDEGTYNYWDLREHQPLWNNELQINNSVDPSAYAPEYFQINGNSSPEIDLDPLAKIIGNVGQEIKLVIVNNGQSIHSIHFHGYHVTIVESSKNSSHIGRYKDTFPVYPSEYMLLSFNPDKPGLYPVHDHNLVALTGGGLYHAGMFTTIEIEP